MPKEKDSRRIALLVRLLTDTASNVVLVKERAFCGSDEPDDLGLDILLSPELTRGQMAQELKLAMADSLRTGGYPNRVAQPGDTEMALDPALFFEFRLLFAETPIYVKTELKEDDPTDPVLIIKSVKRQN